jgi:hypothetical protein
MLARQKSAFEKLVPQPSSLEVKIVAVKFKIINRPVLTTYQEIF